MAEDPPSIWTMDRSGIEQSLRDGRSPRRVYSETDRAAVRAVLDRSYFDELSEGERGHAFTQAWQAHRPSPPPSQASAGSSLAGIGWTVLLASVGLLLFACFGYQTSVHSDADVMGSTYIAARDTINIGLLQNQLMLFLLSLTGILAGTATLLSGAIVDALRSGAITEATR